MVTEIEKATSGQVREVLKLLISGVSSDVSSMESIAGSWWRRLLFMHWFGPRFLGKQMDTFVAIKGERIIGFVIVQYDGDAAGTFDWAFAEPLTDKDNREDFADLIDAALDHVEGQGLHPYFYFGFATSSPAEVKQVLDEIGLRLADYQTTQMVGTLPLAETAQMPDGFRLSPQIAGRSGPRITELLPSVYPGAPPEEIEMIASIHTNTLRSSKIFLIAEEGTEIGFVQQFRWRDELRLLYVLPDRLWGSDAERQLVANLAQTMQGRNLTLRLRTLSKDHLGAARASLSRLGLAWEQAPWQRWVVSLSGEQDREQEDEEEVVETESRYDDHASIWPPQAPHLAPSNGGRAADAPAEDNEKEANESGDRPA